MQSSQRRRQIAHLGRQTRRAPDDRLDEKRAARQIRANRQDGAQPRRRARRLGTPEAGRLVGEVLGRWQRPLRQPRHAQHEAVPLQAEMRVGDAAATGTWLLFLHADTELSPGWSAAAAAFLVAPENHARAGYFHLRLDDDGRLPRWLEAGVALRCRWLALPYGD